MKQKIFYITLLLKIHPISPSESGSMEFKSIQKSAAFHLILLAIAIYNRYAIRIHTTYTKYALLNVAYINVSTQTFQHVFVCL